MINPHTITRFKKYLYVLSLIIVAILLAYGIRNLEHITLTSDKAKLVYDVRQEEKDFPLAFSILAHTDFHRMKRLLTAIYRPHNFYCVHIDRKAGFRLEARISRWELAFGPNVYFIGSEERISVAWGQISLLQAELLCARKALESGYKWKYYINLTGQELPLRTNWELVRVLRLINGSNLMEAYKARKRLWAIPLAKNYGNLSIIWYEGSFHVALTRSFVEFMLHEPTSKLLLKAIQEHERNINLPVVSDEIYFATLSNNPSVFPVPGAYLGGPDKCAKLPLFLRYKVWKNEGQECRSNQFRHSICMLGQNDLPLLIQSPSLFANKFIPEVEPEGYDQLEHWIQIKNQYELDHQELHPSFNQSYYENLEIRWNHL